MNRRSFLTGAGSALATPNLIDLAHSQADTASSRPPARPNVVLIICDDLGYGDLGCYGSQIKTPNLDGLAANGMRLTNHITPTAICSASRAALMTGRYPVRVATPGVFFPLDTTGMSLDAKTLGDTMRGAGYRTMAIGKWHLGHTRQYLPTERGFDEYYGVPYSVDMDPLPLLHNLTVIEAEADRSLLTQQYTEQARSFIERSKDRPFFLYMAHSYPHIPLHASKRFLGQSHLGIYGDVTQEIDWSVGEVLNTLKRSRLDENTLVIFTSDHGPWFQGSTGLLRGRKATAYEGGVRIPMIASLPGVIPRGKVSDSLSSHLDVLPTMASLCGGSYNEKQIDGINILPTLTARQQEADRKPHLHFQGWNIQCARWKQWKLWISRSNTPPFLPRLREGRTNFMLRRPELYNLALDQKESYDVAAEHPDIVALIQAGIRQQLTSLPDQVHRAYSDTDEHETNPWMPAGSFAEFRNAQGSDSAWLKGPRAQALLKQFENLRSSGPKL